MAAAQVGSGISFFFRPVGAVVAGHLGDEIGRRAIGAVLGGAFAPTIAEALQTSTGTVYSVGAYLAGMTIIGIVASLFVRARPGRDLKAGDLPRDRTADPS